MNIEYTIHRVLIRAMGLVALSLYATKWISVISQETRGTVPYNSSLCVSGNPLAWAEANLVQANEDLDIAKHCMCGTYSV